MAGIGRSVADSYVSQLRGEVSWVRQALLHICPPPRFWVEQFAGLDRSTQLATLRRIRDEWITGEKTGQIPQFTRAQRRMHHAATRWRTWGIWLAVLGWLGLAALWTIALIPRFHEWFEPVTGSLAEPNPIYVTLASALVVFGGLCIAYSERCGVRGSGQTI